MALAPKKISEFDQAPGTTALSTDLTVISRGGVTYKLPFSMLRAFVAGELGEIIVSDGEQASVAAALDTAETQSALSTTPVTIHITKSPTALWSRGVGGGGSQGARLSRINIWFADGVNIGKDPATWNTENCLFQLQHLNGCRIYGNAILDGGQPSVPLGTISNLNGTAGDGIRFFSCSDVVVEDVWFQNMGDSFIRSTLVSTDAAGAPDNCRRMILNRVKASKCGQFSTTNSSAEVAGHYQLAVRDCWFQEMNSFKVATRAFTRGVSIKNCYFKGCVTSIEIDGVTDICLERNFHDTPTLKAINIISNNSFIAGTKAAFRNIYVNDFGLNCPGGIGLQPDNQSVGFEFSCENVDMTFTHEGTTSNTGYGFDLDGCFSNLKVCLVSKDWSAGQPIRYNARNVGINTNAHLILDGTFSSHASYEKIAIEVNADSASRGQFDIDGLHIEYRNAHLRNMSRGIILQPATRTLGTASGATVGATAYNVGTTSIALASAGTGTIVAGDAIRFTGGSIGTASGAQTNNAGYAIGATSITLNSAGTGSILAGDWVRFGSSHDVNWYLVSSGDADVSNGGSITLAAPGLLVAIPASNTSITVSPLDTNVYSVNTGDADVSDGGTIVLDTPLQQPVHAGRAIQIMPRYFVNNLKISGNLSGSLTSNAFLYNGSQQSVYLDMRGHRCALTRGAGYTFARFTGGVIENCHIDTPLLPLVVQNTCGGIRIGKNDIHTAGVPSLPDNSQGFKMASGTRSTTQVDVDITHGLGTDLTVPSNSARCFSFLKADGFTAIKINSVAKVDADTIRFTLASDPGASGNLLICHGDDQIVNALNGGVADGAYLPYDNTSGIAARLQRGTITVA